MLKKELDITVISDVHLGTYACHATELLQYLKSINTKSLILNGDFIDIWEFKKRSFPKEHLAVLQYILKMATEGTKVYYLTGNHDDVLRKFSPFLAGNIILRDKLVLQFDNKKYWVFHGDVFDASVTISPFIAKLAGRGYTLLIKINRILNKIRQSLGKKKLSLAHRVKRSVKGAMKFISDFENLAISHAQKQGYDYVICGHVHLPQIKYIKDSNLIYMNSGDWVENLTALEYCYNEWSIYTYDPLDYRLPNPRLDLKKQARKSGKKSEKSLLLNED